MDLSDALEPGSYIGSYEIFEITVAEQKGTVIKTMESIGLTNAAADLSKRLDKTAIQMLNYLTRLAESATKSTIPYRSGTLRDTNVKASKPYFRSGNNLEQTRTVTVEGEHLPPYKSQEHSAALVALALDTKAFVRGGIDGRGSKSSMPIDGFSAVSGGLTTNWTIKAHNQFERKKDSLLLSRFI